MSSRVPLLVKSKGRKPSRVSIAPRAKPSNAPRTKRPVTPESDKLKNNDAEMVKSNEAQKTTEKPAATSEKTPMSSAQNAAKPAAPAVKIAVSKPSNVAKPSVVAKPSGVAKPSTVAKPAAIITDTSGGSSAGAGASTSPVAQPRRADGIAIGGSFSATSASTVLKSPGTRPVPTVRSPIVLPMQRRPERLAKITSAGPVYRASPVMRPRAGSIGSSSAIRPRAGSIGSSPAVRPRGGSIGSSFAVDPQNSMKQRLLRKLDIKPHQSPRRSAMHQQQLRNQNGPTSPLMLGGKPAPEISKDVPDVQLDTQQSRRATTTKTTRARAAPTKKKRAVPAKRRKTSETTSVQTSTSTSTPQRRSLRRKAKRSSYRETDGSGSSGSEPDDDRDEDVDPKDLDLPEDEMNVYVPARERATIWAKSLLSKDEEGEKGGDNKEGETSQALVVREKKTPSRRKRSNSNASSVSSVVTGIGVGIISRSKMEELLKKEPSQMTMGELALTVPKGRRMKRHEREEAASDTPLLTSGEGSSNLLNVNALNRVRSLSVSSESAAFAGSLVTPQVQIIDGQMVVMENTIKLGDELQRTADALGESSVGGESTGLPPRHSGSRYNSSHPNGPGKRWGKEETKQFYYCLSQVGPNFSMMATLFPTRKRKELKSKFKYEEKNHAKLIEIALRASTAPLDSEMVDVISQMVDKEAQRKLAAQKKKRKPRSQLDLLRGGQDDDIASVASSMVSSPMSTMEHTEEFVETLNDADLFPPSRRGSFDFSG